MLMLASNSMSEITRLVQIKKILDWNLLRPQKRMRWQPRIHKMEMQHRSEEPWAECLIFFQLKESTFATGRR